MFDANIGVISNFFKEVVYTSTYERQEAILNYLKENKHSTIKELSKLVWSSESSVRRDIKSLEQKGYVKQVYGAVVSAEHENSIVPVTLRDSSNILIKETLAKKAVNHIFSGATIFMDGSTTVRQIIKHIDKFKELKIITYNQRIFSECTHPNIKLYCTGGLFNMQNGIFYGSAAENYINNTSADLFFFSSQALSYDGEASDVYEEETSIRKAMLARSKKKIFLCDSSKLGLQKTFKLCTKDDIDLIICDKKLPWE